MASATSINPSKAVPRHPDRGQFLATVEGGADLFASQKPWTSALRRWELRATAGVPPGARKSDDRVTELLNAHGKFSRDIEAVLTIAKAVGNVDTAGSEPAPR